MSKLLKYMKVYYHWMIKKNIELNYLPEDISIEVTNTCNFKCHFCPQSNPDHFKIVQRNHLKPDQAEILLRKLREGGIKTNVIHWTLDGEPFINKKFHEINKVGHQYGFNNVIFSTNGTFATRERLLEFPNGNGSKYTLCIDFCDDEEYFETVRGQDGSWKTIKQNIEGILAEPKLSHVHITITDISSYKFTDPEDLKRRFRNLQNLFPPSKNLDFATRVFHNATGFVKNLFKKKSDKYHLCPYPWTSLVIASNGNVVACCRDLEHKTVLGNLFTQDLLEIWNGEKYKKMRQLLVDKNLDGITACQGCDLPYDDSKFSMRQMVKTAFGRLQVFD